MRKYFKNDCNMAFIYVLFISYFIFLLTNGIGNLKYSNDKKLNFMQDKFYETEEKYDYLIKNMTIGNIEENNREILYLEEVKNEILDTLEQEGEFWLLDLKNLINSKEELLIKKFLNENEDKSRNINYIKLKNQIDEYNLYYSIKKKPVEFSESIFLKYFTFVFNSRIHQFFLTFVILISGFIIMNSGRNMKYKAWKPFLIIISLFLLVQIVNIFIWVIIDNSFDIFYPTRVIKGFIHLEDKIIFDIVPFYSIILYTFFLEILYIVFILFVVGILRLIFDFLYLRILGIITFFSVMISLMFTKYSGISVFSYGKFFDLARGYEVLFKSNEFLSINVFIGFVLFTMFIFLILYFNKKYILNKY